MRWLLRLLGLGGSPDPWSTSVGSENGQTVIVRTRSGPPAAWPAERYSGSVELLWPYDGSQTNGMPSTETNTAMTEFEDAAAALETPDLGLLGLCITGNGRREWVWYVTDPAVFKKRVATLTANRYPVQVRPTGAP